MNKILFTFILMVMASTGFVTACTNFMLKAKDGTVLVSRTMEFAYDTKSGLRATPRETKYEMIAPNGKKGMSWTTKYGYIYVDGNGEKAAGDGVNEQGLSFEALYLPGYTKYQSVPPGEENQALPYLHLGDWILGNFKTVEEVKAAVPNIYIFEVIVKELGIAFPLHFSVYDKSGKGIVIEVIDGKIQVHDNPIGVMTNGPDFKWQLTNISNYIHLSPIRPVPVEVDGIKFAASGQGAGLMGIPGDISPPDRFVKMTYMKNFAYQPDDSVGALILAQHIMNNVDIPIGYIRLSDKPNPPVEKTQWTVYKDLTHGVLYYKTTRVAFKKGDIKKLKRR